MKLLFPLSGRRLTQSGIAALLLTFLSFLAAPLAHAQESEDLYRGTWQIDTPDEGSLIVIVKRHGRASYFWGDNADRNVYQGNWTSDADSATLTWADGDSHTIQRQSLGFGATYRNASGAELYKAIAQQVPKEILGQWAEPPTQSEDLISDRDKAKGFFGIWEIESENGTNYVFVESDRSAASTWNADGSMPKGLRGSWAKQGSELHIAWNTGHYSIIRENERGHAYKRIEPGVIIEEDETEFVPASRVDDETVPGTWLSNYESEREVHTAGIAFSSRKVARQFYRGAWLVRLSPEAYEQIEVGRFGGLTTTRNRNLEGQWSMSGQDIFMRWDNGMRKVLSPVANGFLLYEYKPARPLDGVPTRIYPATPADKAKLAEHIADRSEVAAQMHELAESAGIDPAEAGKGGWGRTFSRWVWPFGEDESTTSDALLEEAYEDQPGSADPWWWPFWSEKRPEELAAEADAAADEALEEEAAALAEETTPEAEATETEAEAMVEVPVEEELTEAATDTVEESTETEVPAAKKSKKQKKDWLWPF